VIRAPLALATLLRLVAVCLVGCAVDVTCPLDGSPAAAATGAESTVAPIQLVNQTPVVRSASGLRMDLAVNSPVSPSDLAVQLTLYSDASARSEFEYALGGANLESSGFSLLDTATIDLTAKGVRQADGDLLLDLPVSAPGVLPATTTTPHVPSNGALLSFPPQSTPGVYPLEVGLQDTQTLNTIAAFTTFVVLAPSRSAKPLHFALVLPIGATPAFSPTGVAKPSPLDEQRLEDVASAVALDPNTPVSVAIFPQFISSLEKAAVILPHATRSQRATEGAAALALSALHQLTSSGHVQLDSETYTATDLAAMTTPALGSEVSEQIRASLTALATAKVSVDARVFISTSPLDARTATRLAGEGAADILVPDTAVGGQDSYDWAPFVIEGTQVRADASDPFLASEFDSRSSPALRADDVLADLADLYFAEPYDPPRGVTLLAPDSWQPSTTELSVLLAGLSSDPVVEPDTVSGLFADVPPGSAEAQDMLFRTLTPGKVSATDAISGPAVANARAHLAALASMLPSDSGLLSRLGNDVLLSETGGLPQSARATYLAPVDGELSAKALGVSLPKDRPITMTSLTAKIPISVSSGTKTPLHLDLVLTSQVGELSVSPSIIPLTLSRSNNTVEIRVHARAAGNFRLGLAIRTVVGNYRLASGALFIRSTAISGVAVGLTAGAAVFLLVWWTRSSLKKRHKATHLRRPATPSPT
jgi:hypothetical protein